MAFGKNNKLGSANRLKKESDYKRVFASSCRSTDDAFRVIAADNQLPIARLGLSVANKFIKQAVARNRLKRVIRESFRYHKDLLLGLDVVVVSRGIRYDKENKENILYSLNQHWQYISRCRKS